MIDLRSDTVTQPTDGMRREIAAAAVGDDVYQDDPSVIALEEQVCEILGKDAAVYMPTGTMCNQVGLRTHTQPGDIVLASQRAHVNSRELGAANALAGVTVVELPSVKGVFTAQAVTDAVPQPPPGMPGALYQPVTLVAVENTHNAAGGAVWPLEAMRAIAAAAAQHKIAAHLDGARLWNATVATGTSEREFAEGFDTVSVCFSKGLGAPMGSALAGSHDFIDEARRFKQMYGGGFRQAGMMAAGARYALTHNRQRLAEDHANASRLAMGIAESAGLAVDVDSVATNMVYFSVTSKSAPEFSQACRDNGVLLTAVSSDTIRVVLHLGVSTEDVDRALKVMAAAA